jgi:ABC-type uncharacterized transport system substrate-binding protein
MKTGNRSGELLLKYRVPPVSELRRIAESGGFISYDPNLFDATRRQAYFVDRILKGAKPADLPVEQARAGGQHQNHASTGSYDPASDLRPRR